MAQHGSKMLVAIAKVAAEVGSPQGPLPNCLSGDLKILTWRKQKVYTPKFFLQNPIKKTIKLE